MIGKIEIGMSFSFSARAPLKDAVERYFSQSFKSQLHSYDQAFGLTNDLDVFSVKRRRTRLQLSIPGTANCPFDRREQGFLLQRFPKASYKRTFVRCFRQRRVGMRCDEDCWNLNAVAYEMLLKLQAVHLWHLKIYNQAQGKPSWQRREKLLSRSVSLGTKSART